MTVVRRQDTEETRVPIKNSPTALLAANTSLRETLQPLIEAEAYTVVPAADNETVFHAVIENEPDMIILAHDPPRLDIIQICKSLAERPVHLINQPILILANADDDTLLDEAFEAGATDFIEMPVRQPVLRQRLRTAFNLRKMHGSLNESDDRYRIISDSVSDYAYAYRVTPEGGLVKEWSTKAFEKITGYKPNKLDGDGWSQLIHPDDREKTVQRFYRLLSGKPDVTEFRIITKSGEEKWLLDHGQPIIDEVSGRVVRIIGAAKDITPRKQAEEMLRMQTNELQVRNEELDAFAHTVAHDLKNPISSMMGFTSLVLNYYDRMDDEKIREYLTLIMESGYKLKEIINSLLLLAGVGRTQDVEFETVNMGIAVESACARLINLIEARDAHIEIPDHWPDALGYTPWVEEIWANYLSNALKYGGQPPHIIFGSDEPEDGMVRFWIQDNGSGLTPEEQEQVFMPFTRLSQAKVEGHGLGLSVVQRIVERLNGEVGLVCQIGKGCRFSFTLPVVE